MHNHEIQTIAIFSAQYKNIEDAENAGALYSVDIEYPMTLNDLSRLCDSLPKVGVPRRRQIPVRVPAGSA